MFLLTVLATSVVTAVSLTVYGIASFGEGMMFQILLQVCNRVNGNVCDGNVSTSTLTLSLSAIFSNPIQLWILRDLVDWELGKHLAIFQALGVVIGVKILFISQTLLLPHLLGVLLFVVMLQKVMTDVSAFASKSHSEHTPIKKYIFSSSWTYIAVWATGLASGLLSGMYGTAGPPMIIFFATVNIEKDITRGTVSFCDNVINFFRISSFVYNFLTNGGESASEYGDLSVKQLLVLWAAVTCGAMLGLTLGNYISSYVNQFVFKYMVLFILGIGSVLLASVGMDSENLMIVAVSAVVVFVVANSAAFFVLRKRADSNSCGSSQLSSIEYQRVSVTADDSCQQEDEEAEVDSHRISTAANIKKSKEVEMRH